MSSLRKPYAPPIVLADGEVAHLLEWRQHQRDGSWWAWISWTQISGDPPRHRHLVVEVQADSISPLDEPAAYKDVPRTFHAYDGTIRPWRRP